jgi:hypothetical protein
VRHDPALFDDIPSVFEDIWTESSLFALDPADPERPRPSPPNVYTTVERVRKRSEGLRVWMFLAHADSLYQLMTIPKARRSPEAGHRTRSQSTTTYLLSMSTSSFRE